MVNAIKAIFQGSNIPTEIYAFMKPNGEILTTADDTYPDDELITIACGLVAVFGCDIIITREGVFYDKVKFRKEEFSPVNN